MKENTKRIAYGVRAYMTQDTIDALKQEAHDTNMPVSRVVGRILEERYAKREKS